MSLNHSLFRLCVVRVGSERVSPHLQFAHLLMSYSFECVPAYTRRYIDWLLMHRTRLYELIEKQWKLHWYWPLTCHSCVVFGDETTTTWPNFGWTLSLAAEQRQLTKCVRLGNSWGHRIHRLAFWQMDSLESSHLHVKRPSHSLQSIQNSLFHDKWSIYSINTIRVNNSSAVVKYETGNMRRYRLLNNDKNRITCSNWIREIDANTPSLRPTVRRWIWDRNDFHRHCLIWHIFNFICQRLWHKCEAAMGNIKSIRSTSYSKSKFFFYLLLAFPLLFLFACSRTANR